MTKRVYSRISTDRKVDQRYGEVGNGLKSNNAYFSSIAYADGTVIRTSDGRWSYQPPSRHVTTGLYGKLVEKVNGGAQGELLTAMAEWKSSLAMVTKRVLWILESYKSFRRFDLPQTIAKLARPVQGPAKRRVYGKNERGFTQWNRRPVRVANTPTVTETWLEYWMGWAPAMGDIYNALNILQREFPNTHLRVAVKYTDQWTVAYNSATQRGVDVMKTAGSVGCYADVQVTNYNLYLLNQLGLVNPASTAYNVIPFSFVLDWFVNVKQVLNSLTDFAGVSLRNTGTGDYQAITGAVRQMIYRTQWEGTVQVTQWRPVMGYTERYEKRRTPGVLPSPELVLKFDRLSLTRAATAVSLLVETFLRKRD